MPARPASLWRNPDFVKLWIGQTISEIGSRITIVALPLIAVLVLKATPFQMGLLAGIGGFASLLFGPAAGLCVDRLPRRPILIATDLGRAIVLGSIPLAAMFGMLRMQQIYLVVAAAGILTVLFDVAYQSYLPSLVERQQVLEGNSKLALSSSIAEVAGSGLSGILVQMFTAPMAILLDALSVLASAVTVWLVRKCEPQVDAQENRASREPATAPATSSTATAPPRRPPALPGFRRTGLLAGQHKDRLDRPIQSLRYFVGEQRSTSGRECRTKPCTSTGFSSPEVFDKHDVIV
jgi:MFS family permease